MPLNQQDLENVSSLLPKSKVCPKSWIGLKKSDGKLFDLENNFVPFKRWNRNEPNGMDYEQCVSLRDELYFDVHCTAAIPVWSIYALRSRSPRHARLQ